MGGASGHSFGVSYVGLMVISVVEFLWAKLPITLDTSRELQPEEVTQCVCPVGVGVLMSCCEGVFGIHLSE